MQFDLVQDDFLKLWNHDEIARTEDFYLGTAASVRAGWADTALGLEPERAHLPEQRLEGLSRRRLDAAAVRGLLRTGDRW